MRIELIWLVRFAIVLLSAVLFMLLLGYAIGFAGPEWCMFPEINIVRPIRCDMASLLYRPA